MKEPQIWSNDKTIITSLLHEHFTATQTLQEVEYVATSMNTHARDPGINEHRRPPRKKKPLFTARDTIIYENIYSKMWQKFSKYQGTTKHIKTIPPKKFRPGKFRECLLPFTPSFSFSHLIVKNSNIISQNGESAGTRKQSTQHFGHKTTI